MDETWRAPKETLKVSGSVTPEGLLQEEFHLKVICWKREDRNRWALEWHSLSALMLSVSRLLTI